MAKDFKNTSTLAKSGHTVQEVPNHANNNIPSSSTHLPPCTHNQCDQKKSPNAYKICPK